MNSVTLLGLLEDEFFDQKGYLRRKVDLNRCVALLQELRSVLSEDVFKAQEIIAKKENILKNADAVAKNMILDAEKKAKKMAEHNEVFQIANAEAQKLMNKAKIQRDVLIDKTKIHLESIFDQAEQILVSLINVIRKNRQELKSINFN